MPHFSKPEPEPELGKVEDSLELGGCKAGAILGRD